MELLWISSAQQRKFRLLVQPDEWWKCASSIARIMTSSDKIPFKLSSTVPRCVMSRSRNSWKFRSLCKIFVMLRTDIPRATEYLLAERLGLPMNYCLTAYMFCGDRTVCTQAGGLFLNAEVLILEFSTHNCKVLRQGTFPWRGVLRCLRNIRCILITESPFKKKRFNNKRTMFARSTAPWLLQRQQLI
jgi:hypothetical protein